MPETKPGQCGWRESAISFVFDAGTVPLPHGYSRTVYVQLFSVQATRVGVREGAELKLKWVVSAVC